MIASSEIIERVKVRVGITGNTDSIFYNETYPILIAAGHRWITQGHRESLLVVALGLLAWTQGAKWARERMDPLLRAAEDSRATLASQIQTLREHLAGPDFPRATLEKSLKDVLESLLPLVALNTGSESISLLSKLLHFLEPGYFLIYDERVAKNLCDEEKATAPDFVEVQIALWEVGFHLPRCPDSAPEFATYWNTPDATPMRVVDCTFF